MSPFFKNLWKYKSNETNISFEYSDESVENAINILCNGCSIVEYNHFDVISVAAYLQCKELMNNFTAFLTLCIDYKNCLKILFYNEIYLHSSELRKKAIEFEFWKSCARNTYVQQNCSSGQHLQVTASEPLHICN